MAKVGAVKPITNPARAISERIFIASFFLFELRLNWTVFLTALLAANRDNVEKRALNRVDYWGIVKHLDRATLKN